MGLFGKSKVETLGESLSEQTKAGLDAAAMSEAERAAIDAGLFDYAEYNAADAERSGYSNYSYWQSTFRIFWRNKMARFLVVFLGLLLAFTFIQPYLPGQIDPNFIHYDADGNLMKNFAMGEQGFLFGTDNLGRDGWSRVWFGIRTSLFIGFVVALSECVIGITVGVLWGYVRKVDRLFTEIYNIIDNIPRTIILILISYILRPSMSTIIISMCFVGWLPMARFVRNQIVIIRDRDYNLASRCLGSSTGRIIFRNLLPYLISVIMLRVALAVPTAITDEVFLTYTGLGLPLDTPSLGTLIIYGRSLITNRSLMHLLVIPCVALSVVTVCFYVIGNAFADAADPKNHV
jgi:oligopeptide transport system permease protein